MASFKIHYRSGDGTLGESVVQSTSFQDALVRARSLLPTASFLRVQMMDSEADVSLRCPECDGKFAGRVQWGSSSEQVIKCALCGTSLRLRRERPVIAQQAMNAAGALRRVLGSPPQSTSEHTRPPSRSDKLRAAIENPELVKWRCRACRMELVCDWGERSDVHDCPNCGCGQHVPGSSFSWNSRVLREREQNSRAAVYLEEQRQRAAIVEKEREAQRLKAQQEAVQREAERQFLARMRLLEDIAVGAGLVESADHFRNLDPEAVDDIAIMCDLASELQTDLLGAMDDNAAADRAVAEGRPLAAGASAVSFLADYNWVGLTFGALALGARWLSDDWKRAKVSEYQAKWARRFAQLSSAEMAAFTAIFVYRYPALANTAGAMQGRIAP